jgi:uncharacterized protein (DUF2267 family)
MWNAVRFGVIREEELTRTVKARAGLQTAAEARRALGSAIGALRCALDEQDAREMAAQLPRRLARILDRKPDTVVRNVEGLYAEALRRERVGVGFAREHVQVVIQVLGSCVDPELVGKLERRLPRDIAALFQRRPAESPPPAHTRLHPDKAKTARVTLSMARPGFADTIADAHHPLAHRASVARSNAPHAERMVETAHSTRPGREDETLASSPRRTR